MATIADERQALLDRFVVLDAVGIFISNLGNAAAVPLGDRPLAEILEVDRHLEAVHDALGAAELDQLWPTILEVDEEPTDRVAARVRSERLAARMFLAVAQDPEYCARAAAYFLELADRTEANA